MPRPVRKAKTKAAKVIVEGEVDGNIAAPGAAPAAVAEAPAEAPAEVAPPPAAPTETPAPQPEAPAKEKTRGKAPAEDDKDKIAVTALNIAKLQAMSMPDLNHMARELGVENFGTMRKHEVIFHILQKNAERAGVLFSEGVLEILAEGFAPRASITSRAPRTSMSRPPRSGDSICRPAT
jgi:transcription termination factor Rho